MRGWGGAEVWMLETAQALRQRGFAADIVTQPDAELLVRARRIGVPVAAVPIRFDAAPWTVARLWAHFRRHRTSAILTNLTKDLKAAALAGRLAGVPVILASRESDFPLKNKAYYRWYFGRLATGLLVNSLATRDTILASAPWLAPERVHLLYKGIDTQRFVLRAAAPRSGTVGFVGQLIARKGLHELMAAWRYLETEFAILEPRLRLAGEGPLRPVLEAWRTRLHHPERVEICGYREDVASFYAGLDLLVLPSHAEGFGLAAAEAAACGVPVVGTNASSLPEIVVDGETGLLVPPHDSAALARAMARLLTDTELASRLGRAGRRRVEAEFPRDKLLQRLLVLTGGRDDDERITS